MFKKHATTRAGSVISDDIETIIGPSVKIEGDFTSSGNVVVGGVILGKLTTTESLRVEEQAKVQAAVNAKEAVIAGEIIGNITISGHLEILSTAKINGDIKTGSISIQQGAELNGNFVMGGSGEAQGVTLPFKEARAQEKIQATKEWLEDHHLEANDQTAHSSKTH